MKVRLHDTNELSKKDNKIVLTVPLGLSMETPPLRIDGSKEIYWRIRADREGVYDLGFRVHNMEVKKKVFVTPKITRLSPETFKGGIVNSFLYPGEPSLTEGTVLESIKVTYPSAKISLFGWNIHWLVLFFILTLIFGFVLMKPFKVRI